MEGTSSASCPPTHDVHHFVDDFYFSALYDKEVIFPISDEKYAEELQLQEALFSSAILRTRFRNEAIQLDVDFDTSLRTLKGKEKEKETGQCSQSQVFCAICMEATAAGEMFTNQNCSHSFCDDCVGKYAATKIQENISMVKCPDPKCRGILEPHLCRSIIPVDVFVRWENDLCENLVLGLQKFYCPFKDCSAMLVDDGEEVMTASEYPHCRRLFCAQCKVSWHAGIDCREFRSLKEGQREREDLMVLELPKNKRWRRCPNCKFFVEKVEGCQQDFLQLGDLAIGVVKTFAMAVDPSGVGPMHVYLIKNCHGRQKQQSKVAL